MKHRPLYCLLIPLLGGGLLLAGAARGQSEPKPGAGAPEVAPPRPKPPKGPGGPPAGGPQGRGDWRGGPDRRGGPGGMGGGGRPPMWEEGFDKLTEEQKRRVREVLGKAWGRPEVAQARDRVMRANMEMRDALHKAIEEIDPEIGSLLASMRGPEHGHGRGEMPKMPEVESPEYPDAVVKRLELELLAFSPPERREEARKLHARLIELPEIQAAVRRLREVPVPERKAAMESLRGTYREIMGRELGKIREKREGEGKGREPGKPPGPEN